MVCDTLTFTIQIYVHMNAEDESSTFKLWRFSYALWIWFKLFTLNLFQMFWISWKSCIYENGLILYEMIKIYTFVESWMCKHTYHMRIHCGLILFYSQKQRETLCNHSASINMYIHACRHTHTHTNSTDMQGRCDFRQNLLSRWMYSMSENEEETFFRNSISATFSSENSRIKSCMQHRNPIVSSFDVVI